VRRLRSGVRDAALLLARHGLVPVIAAALSGCAARASVVLGPAAAPEAVLVAMRPVAPSFAGRTGDPADLVAQVEARVATLGGSCERGGEQGVPLTCYLAEPTPRLVFVASSEADIDPVVHAVYTTRGPGGTPSCEVLGFRAAAFDYLCGGGWQAALELALYDAIAADPPPLRPDRVLQRTVAVLTAFGIDSADAPATVEALLAALPPGDRNGLPTYTPIATALALGTMLGEDARAAAPRFEWADSGASLTRYYGLRDAGSGECLRPVEFVIQLLRAPMPGAASAYRAFAVPPAARRR